MKGVKRNGGLDGRGGVDFRSPNMTRTGKVNIQVARPISHKDLFLTCGTDTPNTAKERDMTLTSAARLLILDPAFPLRAVCSPCRSAPASCCALLATCRLSDGDGAPLDPQPGWKDCDSHSGSKMQRFGGGGFLPGFCRGGVVGFKGINWNESPGRGVGKRKRWLQPGERRSQTRLVDSPSRTKFIIPVGKRPHHRSTYLLPG